MVVVAERDCDRPFFMMSDMSGLEGAIAFFMMSVMSGTAPRGLSSRALNRVRKVRITYTRSTDSENSGFAAARRDRDP